MLALVKPKPKLASSVDFFREHGVDTLGVAPLDIVSVTSEIAALTAWLQNPQANSTLYIVTSTEAATRFKQILPANWRGKHAFCVGESTARLIQEHFDRCEFPESQNSEGIIAEVDTYLTDCSDVAILKGEGGRQLIREYLSQQSVDTREFSLYKRVQLLPPFMPHKVHWENIDMVAVTSSELLSNLLDAFPNESIPQKVLIVPSERVKAQATAFGCKEIITSNGATNAHLLRCVNTLQRGRT